MSSQQPMRKAFSMITAIFVIVIMASLAAFVMSLSGKIVKTTTAQFQHEQAVLYAKSYTEFTVMAISAHNRQTSGCVQKISGTIGSPTSGNGYSIEAYISYISTSATVIGTCPGTRKLSTNVTTSFTPLTAIIDVYVHYKDLDNTSAPYLTVHRRTVQKI